MSGQETRVSIPETIKYCGESIRTDVPRVDDPTREPDRVLYNTALSRVLLGLPKSYDATALGYQVRCLVMQAVAGRVEAIKGFSTQEITYRELY